MPKRLVTTPGGRALLPVVAILIMVTIGVVAIVGLELADRPVSAIVYLLTAVIVPTIPALFALTGVQRANYTLENGLKDEIAARVREDAAEVALALAEEMARQRLEHIKHPMR